MITRKGIATVAAVMIMAATLLGLTMTSAAAASLRIELRYEPEGENTRVTVTVLNAPDIFSLELAFDMAGKTYIESEVLTPPVALSMFLFESKENVLKYLVLECAEPYDHDNFLSKGRDADGNNTLCTFVYSGDGIFESFKAVGGVLDDGSYIDSAEIVTVNPPPFKTPPAPSALIPGDINGDGQVDINDILLIRDLVFGIKEQTAEHIAAINMLMSNTLPNANVILAVRDVIFGNYFSPN